MLTLPKYYIKACLVITKVRSLYKTVRLHREERYLKSQTLVVELAISIYHPIKNSF